jgi:hypothetical protein
MGRQSLHARLSERKDFKEILKKVSLVEKPVKWVMDNFNVSYPCADRFVQEVKGCVVVSGNTATEKSNSVQIDNYLDRIKASLVNERLSLQGLLAFCEELERFNAPTLMELLDRVIPNTSRALCNEKIPLINGVKFAIQFKYYFSKELQDKFTGKLNDKIGSCSKQLNT